MISVWELCHVDPVVVEELDFIQEEWNGAEISSKHTHEISTEVPSSSSAGFHSKEALDNKIQSLLCDTNESCKIALEVLDSVLIIVQDVKNAYFDVTGRTNSLIQKCEDLLDQQHTLQNTVEVLQQTLQPFDEIEEVASLLGIPFNVPSSGVMSGSMQKANTSAFDGGSSTALDPRSPEFQDILNKLSRAVHFLRSHTEIMESERYIQWLDKLQIRATSLIGKAMKDLIDKAAKQCRDIMQQKMYHHSSSKSQSQNPSNANRNGSAGEGANKVLLFEDQPLESSFIYQKFRGLSFRMKELASVLLRGSLSEFHHETNNSPTASDNSPRIDANENKSGNGHRYHSGNAYKFHDTTVVTEVKKAYIMIRLELLVPFIKEAWTSSYVAVHLNQSTTNISNHVTLSSGLRHAFSTLLRVTQLEYQLFDSLFNIDNCQDGERRLNGSTLQIKSTENHADAISVVASNDQLSQDMVRIIENISNCTRDILRPYIIRESSVDELCRVISALTEDMRSQITVLSIPSLLSKQLLLGLESTINDAKERLTYCAETKLRQDVEMFEPLPSQLSYPDILESYEDSKKKEQPGGKSVIVRGEKDPQVEVYQTWYPPMKQTLSLLSKLYGVVEMAIFEDFARRCIDLCIKSLLHASDGVRRTRQAIHGDLFLVRHLLTLREQLIPFEIKMHSVERQLDFTTTTLAWSKMIHTARTTATSGNSVGTAESSGVSFGGVNSLAYLTTLMRFDQNNLFFQFARQGVPTMQEFHIDAKKDLDFSLKKACISFKQSAIKMMLGPMDSLLAKVSAFAGEIPTDASLNSQSVDGEELHKGQLLAGGMSQLAILPAETKQTLKAQSFLRPERIKECLEQVQQLLLQRLPDVKEMLKLYIENGAARTVLAKSVLQEFETLKKKLECIIGNCVDPGQTLRELEHLLQTINYSITSELSNGC